MIWTLQNVADLMPRFVDAGPIDESVVARYTATTRQRQHAPTKQGVARYYYLLADDPRISLLCMAMPLDAWQGGAMIIVGTREIIGEFAGNHDLAGCKGLQLKMQPLSWLQGAPDRRFATGAELLAEISEQVLDLPAAERSQRKIAKKYRWR